MFTASELMPAIQPVQDWYLQHARTLPWRSDPTPYHVWISEIMLQQTRVEAVIPYYERFIRELPDVEALSVCPEETYLKLWEGLGYYSRVRNLHAAACQIMEQYGGELPSEYEALRKLKGIGPYTAGAIASIAFQQPEPAVDGNVLRVLMRLTGDASDIMLQSTKTMVEDGLRTVMQQWNQECMETEKKLLLQPRILTQALMELGALVCVPNGAPHCDICPWQTLCRAHAEGLTEQLPVKKKAKERRIEERTVLILRDGSRAAIHKRPGKGLLAGLYELPNRLGHMTQDEVAAYVKSMGFAALRIEPLEPARHIFSHIEWQMIGYVVKIEEAGLASETELRLREREELIFTDADEVAERYAIPTAFSTYVGYV